MNRLYKLLINKDVFKVPHELYLNKLFVNMSMVLVVSMAFQEFLHQMGIFYNLGPVIYALICGVISLIINKITGNIALSSNFAIVGVLVVIYFISKESGGVFSYNLRWMICVLLVSFLFSNNERKSMVIPMLFTFACLGIVVLFYFYSFSEEEAIIQSTLSFNSSDYAIDNILFILTLSGLAFLIQRVQNYLITKYQDKNKRLESANQELERFAFIASHDLKEPVRNICSFSQLALHRLEQNDVEGAKDFLNYVVNNSSQMNSLIVNTLALMTQKEVKKTSVDLNTIIRQVEALIEEDIPDKPCSIQVPNQLPVVMGSSNELLTCLKQLVSNGLTFNQSLKPTIVIHSRSEPAEYVISVEDNGKGIEPEYQDQIFLMYKRLENRSVYTGSGLGLSICKKLIERWGGRIWVKSAVGQGSVFYFTIPKVS